MFINSDTGQFKKHGLAFSAENAHFWSKMEMKIPWEWTWEKYVEKSQKVEIKMQSASNFFPLGENLGVGYGFWRRHECWRKVGRKKTRKYWDLFRKQKFPKCVGNVGAGLVRPVRTCWDRFGPIFMGKMHIKICRVFWVILIFKMALYVHV